VAPVISVVAVILVAAGAAISAEAEEAVDNPIRGTGINDHFIFTQININFTTYDRYERVNQKRGRRAAGRINPYGPFFCGLGDDR
jgi:hypothetical protein